MISYRIQSLFMHNFKLFDNASIHFDSNNLIVLDGPNGYGKTSTFDAIEYIITGTIKRVEEKEEINGKNAYDSNFLTKNPSDGTPAYARATFCSEDSKNVLDICRTLQSAEKSENNPKKLSIHTTTTVIYNGETILKDSDKRTANIAIGKILGNSVLQCMDKYFIKR